MIEFYKNLDTKNALNYIIDSRVLITALFKDIPDLKSVSFSCSSEYDDNNYYDSVQVTEINGWAYSHYEACYEDEMEEDYQRGLKNNPIGKRLDKDFCMACLELVDEVGKSFGHCDHSFKRDEYTFDEGSDPQVLCKKTREENEFNKFILNLACGNLQQDESIFERIDSKWALYYAFDHGRLSKEVEDKIFLKKGNMKSAYLYSVHILKDVLPKNIEDFYILNSFAKKKKTETKNTDQEYLGKYLEFKKTLVTK